jgi:3-methyladenine DNA glycosylase AlkD
MNSQALLKDVRKKLRDNSDPAAKASFVRFFKEKVTGYGVKSAIVGKIAKEAYALIKGLPKSEIFGMCELLMASGQIEERFIADDWAERQAKNYTGSDFKTFDKWVHNYVSNWAECDTLCNHSVGSFISMFPGFMPEFKKWARSDNRWVKRASCVSLILPARRGEFLADVFELADILLLDLDDMVQKGYGWMLKEASRKHTKEVFDYVVKHKKNMPRTALRYAIEKMPVNLKKKAMEK